ncbi:type 4a pilus biogenesis protein PilO [Calidithermus roseus]|uniref:Pilus assembly protein, PilO n=1 Tax=Calidithermus roseus TaxID=1644118 RepID=A0A399EZM4_9DEIN|nr:type 4a pilus biogenesis protein PilO [Calidithermus roseus]RIH88856.1 Pilus assembly protein, PilO [Calidithermus roseus]
MLARLGQREWAIIVIVISVLLGIGLYIFLIQPMQSQIANLQSQIAELSVQRDRGRAAERALPQLRATIIDLELQRQRFFRELPPQEDLSQVLTLLTQLARRSGVTLKSIGRTTGGSEVAGVRTINLAMQVESPFPELFTFLKQLENLQRFATISGLNLTVGAESSNPVINSSMTMTVYVYTGQTAAPEGGQP